MTVSSCRNHTKCSTRQLVAESLTKQLKEKLPTSVHFPLTRHMAAACACLTPTPRAPTCLQCAPLDRSRQPFPSGNDSPLSGGGFSEASGAIPTDQSQRCMHSAVKFRGPVTLRPGRRPGPCHPQPHGVGSVGRRPGQGRQHGRRGAPPCPGLVINRGGDAIRTLERRGMEKDNGVRVEKKVKKRCSKSIRCRFQRNMQLLANKF